MTKPLDQRFTTELMTWYRKNHRDLPWRKDKEPYHVWVSEIMLQQTRVEAVRDYYIRFMRKVPTVKDLASAEEQTLLKLWEGLGYYHRIRNMHKAAKLIVDSLKGEFPSEHGEILKLSGIGDYTAGAIASICFEQGTPAVDGNVLRVMTRITEDNKTKKQVGQLLEDLYPEMGCGDFTQGLIELGALICVPKGQPKCELCPVLKYCKARSKGTELQFPIKMVKKPRREVEKTVFLLRCGNQLAVQKRENKGLLAGLYEFPNMDETMPPSQAVKVAEDWGCQPIDIQKRVEYKHIFSHVEWKMTGYYLTCRVKSQQFQWVTQAKLHREIPLPTAFGYFVEE